MPEDPGLRLPPDPERWDIGNSLLSPSPIQITLTLATDPAGGGQELIVTARTSTGTLTGTMDRGGAQVLAASLTGKTAKMTGLIRPAGDGHHAP